MIDTELLTADEKLKYAMLGRLQSDCEYYLNWGNKNKKCLWAGLEHQKILKTNFQQN